MRRKPAAAAPIQAADPIVPFDTLDAISNNTQIACGKLINSAERLDTLAARYREMAAAIARTN